MKTSLYTNCSLVRVPIEAGENTYYLPQNVDWAKERVDKIVMVCPQTACTDPMDGTTPVLAISDVTECYITLVDADNREIFHDVSFDQILHKNNNTLPVDAVLNLSLCKITFTQTPSAAGTLLLYVFYQSCQEEYFDVPDKSITVQFELQADQEISFRDIIDYYVHAIPSTIKGVICWNAITDPVWITLRDKELTYQMANIHSELCRKDAWSTYAYDTQVQPFYVNDLNIDFDYSRIREAAGQTSTQKITFLY